MDYSPLLEFEGITRIILRYEETLAAPFKANEKGYWIEHSPVFHCDREYTASWYIRDNKLYLGKVTPREFYVTKNNIFYFDGPQVINQKKINKRVESAVGQKYKKKLILADWVNGEITGNIGGVPCIEKKLGSRVLIIDSSKDVKMYFEKGLLKTFEVIDHKK